MLELSSLNFILLSITKHPKNNNHVARAWYAEPNTILYLAINKYFCPNSVTHPFLSYLTYLLSNALVQNKSSNVLTIP